MKPYTEAYLATVLCATATAVMLYSTFKWWQIAIAIIATLVCLAIGLDLHTQHRDRQRLRGQG